MALYIYKTLWGDDAPLDALIPTLASRGFAGIEACLIYLPNESKQTLLQASRQGLQLVIMLQTSGENVTEHLASLDMQIADALAYNPVLLNIHGGLDRWSESESDGYFQGFLSLQEKYSTLASESASGTAPAMLHETHRGRILYNPWTSLRLLKKFPSLLITADLSHWVVVAERHLNTSEFDEIMKIVVERTRHIHARPCSPQRIQLSCKEMIHSDYSSDMNAFNGYWRSIMREALRQGRSVSVDPEIGPFPYQLAQSPSSVIDEDISCVVSIVRQVFAAVVAEL